MENCPFIDGLPIKNGDFPWQEVTNITFFWAPRRRSERLGQVDVGNDASLQSLFNTWSKMVQGAAMGCDVCRLDKWKKSESPVTLWLCQNSY